MAVGKLASGVVDHAKLAAVDRSARRDAAAHLGRVTRRLEKSARQRVARGANGTSASARRRLRHREGCLGHGVTSRQRTWIESVWRKTGGELIVAVGAHRLAAVHEETNAVQPNPLEVLVAYARRHEIVREVWKPGQRGVLARAGVEEKHRRGDPLERIDGDHGHAGGERQMKGGDEPHVVVQRQPAYDAIVSGQPNRVTVSSHMLQNREL